MGDSRLEFSNSGEWGRYLRAKRTPQQYPTAAKRPSENECPLDWGDSFSLGQTGRAIIDCRGDTNRIAHPLVLAYGKTIRGKGWQCTSQTDGMRCQNRSKHGFWLNRTRQTLF